LDQPRGAPGLDLIQNERFPLAEVIARQAFGDAVQRNPTIKIDSHPMQKQNVSKQKPNEHAGIQLRECLVAGFCRCPIIPVEGDKNGLISAESCSVRNNGFNVRLCDDLLAGSVENQFLKF
jgi:hypothetical protein